MNADVCEAFFLCFPIFFLSFWVSKQREGLPNVYHFLNLAPRGDFSRGVSLPASDHMALFLRFFWTFLPLRTDSGRFPDGSRTDEIRYFEAARTFRTVLWNLFKHIYVCVYARVKRYARTRAIEMPFWDKFSPTEVWQWKDFFPLLSQSVSIFWFQRSLIFS